MPRKGRAETREVKPDARFDSPLVTQLINRIMRDGKRSKAEGIVYDALRHIGNRTQGGDPLSVLQRAIDNTRPSLEVKSRRVGGATYQVPVEVRAERRNTLAMRWLIDASRKRGESTMAHRLAGELMDAADSRGAAVKKREDTHRMAEANKAFSHFRW
jgi:small subunit ribosomal protein S7